MTTHHFERQTSLFDNRPPSPPTCTPMDATNTARIAAYSQYMTPCWAAQALVERHLSDLTASDVVVEPTCGRGAFLGAIPSHVPALGIEIDPELADEARCATGRRVITGDFRQVTLDVKPTHLIGNPPFKLALVDQLLDFAHKNLPADGRISLILPAYTTQTASRVVRYSDRWSIMAEQLPRGLFQGIECPIAFFTFRKDQRRVLVGMALYFETDEIARMPKDVQETLRTHSRTWRQVLMDAMDRLGGRATLSQIYSAVAPNRPSANPAWKEQIRKVARQCLTPVGPGEYARAA